jgi:dipeptidyl aminopeptidase/acylaminoacyl peptidase
MCIYNIEKGTTTLAIKTIVSHARPVWSKDSSAVFLNTHSPIGSIWEAEDIRDHHISAKDVHLFELNVVSGLVSEVLHDFPYDDLGPLFEFGNGDVMVRTTATSIARFHRYGDSWREVADVSQPQQNGDWIRFVVTNGRQIIGVHETVTTPEDLFAYEPGDQQIRLLTDLNPQLRNLQFAPVKSIKWRTKDGLDNGSQRSPKV